MGISMTMNRKYVLNQKVKVACSHRSTPKILKHLGYVNRIVAIQEFRGGAPEVQVQYQLAGANPFFLESELDSTTEDCSQPRDDKQEHKTIQEVLEEHPKSPVIIQAPVIKKNETPPVDYMAMLAGA